MPCPRLATTAATTLVLFAVACATTGRYDLPAIVPEATGVWRPGEFVWADLVTDDVGRAKAFYGALFGWEFEPQGAYTRVTFEGRPIGGIARRDGERSDSDVGAAWVSSLSVLDLDRAADRAASAGGRVEIAPVDVGARGRAALVSDPGGAVLMLLRSDGGDPAATAPRYGDWLWRELWTRDAGEAVAFYAALGGYQAVESELRDAAYLVLQRDGEARAGILEDPRKEVDPLWLPYVRVESASDAAERARGLGARVVAQTEDAAILVDPTGAAFGVQAWEGRR